MLIFTSVTKSYLAKAAVLARSLKTWHPDWTFVVILCDELPRTLPPSLGSIDAIIRAEELNIPDWNSWSFGHTLVELCTAVKAVAANYLLDRFGVTKIAYLDPDICVYDTLSDLDDLLNVYDIILTPHLVDPELEGPAVVDNEICALQHGIFNLGFFAARADGEGRDFLNWWSSRLHDHCIDDIGSGLFTDQRWCDLAPAFFSRLHILRNRGFNVATWNVAHRKIKKVKGRYFAGDVPLKFYHFTSFDNGNGRGMLQKYASDQPDAFELWDEYGVNLKNAEFSGSEFSHWAYGLFSNGEPIELAMRRLYRMRSDLREAFPNPQIVEGLHCYLAWWKAENQDGKLTYLVDRKRFKERKRRSIAERLLRWAR